MVAGGERPPPTPRHSRSQPQQATAGAAYKGRQRAGAHIALLSGADIRDLQERLGDALRKRFDAVHAARGYEAEVRRTRATDSALCEHWARLRDAHLGELDRAKRELAALLRELQPYAM